MSAVTLEQPPDVAELPPPAPRPLLTNIPDGDPATAALELLKLIRPQVADDIRGRLKAADDLLEQLLEGARLDPRVDLPSYAKQVARQLRIVNALQARLRALGPGADTPADEDVAAGTLARIRQVARWRDGSALRTTRDTMLSRTRAELAETEDTIKAQLERHRDGRFGHVICDPEHRASGLADPQDHWLRTMGGALARRQELLARIAALDPDGSGARAAALSKAVDPDHVTSVLAPGQPDPHAAEV